MLALGCLRTLDTLRESEYDGADDRPGSVSSKRREEESLVLRSQTTPASPAPHSWVGGFDIACHAVLMSAGRKYLVVRGMPDVEVSGLVFPHGAANRVGRDWTRSPDPFHQGVLRRC